MCPALEMIIGFFVLLLAVFLLVIYILFFIEKQFQKIQKKEFQEKRIFAKIPCMGAKKGKNI